jgi:hypothetical protein
MLNNHGMSVWTSLEWLAQRLLRGARHPAAQDVPSKLVQSSIEAIVQAVEPRLRVVAGYRDELAPVVVRSIRHIDLLVAQLPDPIEISRRAWVNDPLVNALFADADDVTQTLGRSGALRDFFATNPGVATGFALLRATTTERAVLAPGMMNGTVRQDVAQITVSFAEFRLNAVAPDAAACRRQVADWLLRRLAALALERIVADEARMTERQERKALLAAHLRLLKLHADEYHAAPNDRDAHGAGIARLEAELKEASAACGEDLTAVLTLDARLAELNRVLAAPEDQLRLTVEEACLNRLGMKVAEEAEEPHAALTLHELAIGAGGKDIIVLVSCPRAEMPPQQGLPADAAKCGL